MFAKTSLFRLLSALLIGGMLLGNAVLPVSVRADSVITVNTTKDELNADGDCSLREAIQAANTNAAVDACVAGTGVDTITVPAGTYTLTIAGDSENLNATGDLDITDSVTINGAGESATIIQAGTLGYPNVPNGIDRVLHIFSGITVGLSNVTIANGNIANGNTAGYGGGIYNYHGTLNVTNSTFLGNYGYYGGGISDLAAPGSPMTVTNSTFKSNSATAGGGIYNGVGSTLTVTNSTFSGNSAMTVGGGIYNHRSLTVTNSMFSGNSAIEGGGIHNYFGTSTVTNSTFSGNTATKGGGIYNNKLNTFLIVINSTFSDNAADSGGGIYLNGQESDLNHRAVVINSTFSGNSAKDGGGITNTEYGTLTVTNSTFSGNSAIGYGGGIFNLGGTLTLNNSILANSNSDGVDCYKMSGTTSGSHNLIETDSAGSNACGTTAPIHSDPNLGPLADNGSPTQTFALLPGSPAIDSGDDSICAASPVNNTSQNGVTRPQGAHCDIGSFEFPLTSTYTFRSIGANDGWILESTETSGKGGTINVNGQAIALGDHPLDRQYRSILHFDTASLPDNAVITKVTLALKKKSVVGTDPFTTHQYIKVDIRSGGFSNTVALQLTDFQAAASKNWIGTIKNNPVGDWYSAVLKTTAFPYVNLTGATQFRLYFALDDDNDNIADLIKFSSGDDTAANRPQLIVEYYVP